MGMRIISMNGSGHIEIIRKSLNKQVEMHLHDYYEMEMVIKGRGEHNLNGTVYPVTAGSVYFLTPIDFHALTPATDMQIIHLAFDETLLSPQLRMMFMNRRENYVFGEESEQSRTLKTVLELLLEESSRKDEYADICSGNLLEVILYTVLRAKGCDDIISNQVHNSMQYLFCHFREDISLEQVAAKSGYTPNYFSTLFHSSTGEKFVDFLCNLRLNYAKMLLQSTELSISETAEKSGFGSESAMYRRFYKAFGVSPSAYRSQRNKTWNYK